MIIETLLGFASVLIQGAFSTLQIVTLPMDMLTILLDILCYGVWVIGADLMGLIMASVVGWMTFKFTFGLLVFIWRLLPLT